MPMSLMRFNLIDPSLDPAPDMFAHYAARIDDGADTGGGGTQDGQPLLGCAHAGLR